MAGVATAWAEKGLLVGTDSSGVNQIRDRIVGVWPSEITDLESHRVVAMEVLSSEYIVVAVDAVGLMVLDQTGGIVQSLPRQIDYRFGEIKQILHVGNSTVWAATDENIMRVELLKPLTEYSKLLPAARNFPRLLWHQSVLHVNSDNKLFRAISADGGALLGFERLVKEKNLPVVGAISVEQGILFATGDSVKILRDDGTMVSVAELPQITTFAEKPGDPDTVLAIGASHFYLIERESGVWKYRGHSLPSPGVSFIACSDKDSIWTEHGPGLVSRISFSRKPFKVEVFGEEVFGKNGTWINLWKIGNQIVFSGHSDTKLLTWDAENETFTPLNKRKDFQTVSAVS